MSTRVEPVSAALLVERVVGLVLARVDEPARAEKPARHDYAREIEGAPDLVVRVDHPDHPALVQA
jgi:hypothetical protein